MRGLKNVTANTVLGGVSQKNFKIGDLIEWRVLSDSRDVRSLTISEKFHGVIIEFYIEIKTGREVQMARVLPIASQQIVEIPCVILKKVETI